MLGYLLLLVTLRHARTICHRLPPGCGLPVSWTWVWANPIKQNMTLSIGSAAANQRPLNLTSGTKSVYSVSKCSGSPRSNNTLVSSRTGTCKLIRGYEPVGSLGLSKWYYLLRIQSTGDEVERCIWLRFAYLKNRRVTYVSIYIDAVTNLLIFDILSVFFSTVLWHSWPQPRSGSWAPRYRLDEADVRLGLGSQDVAHIVACKLSSTKLLVYASITMQSCKWTPVDEMRSCNFNTRSSELTCSHSVCRKCMKVHVIFKLSSDKYSWIVLS